MTKQSLNTIFGFFGVVAFLVVVFAVTYKGESEDAVSILLSRSSLLLTGSDGFSGFGGGFSAYVLASFVVIAIALALGFVLGSLMVSSSAPVRAIAIFVMNVMRNSPWLVVLYATLYLLPFEISVMGKTVYLSPFVKAVAGLTVPVTAYVAEVFRSGIRAIPDGQWESARALGYNRRQIMRWVILPQALPIMLPNLMTTYSMLFIGTSLMVVTGTADVISIGKTVIGSDGDKYATAIYLYILLMFFVFAYPLATWSRALEQQWKAGR